MSFIATLKNNQIETQSFHNIGDIYEIITLETNDITPIKVDFTTGEIFINNVLQNRLETFFMPHAKPIQYRRVVQEINMGQLDEVLCEWEEQFLGYEYTQVDKKVKIEICSNTEINSIAAYITITDLLTSQKENRVIRLY